MAVMAMCVLLSCTEKKEEATLSGLMKSNFVSEVQGKPTALYVLKNQNGWLQGSATARPILSW